MPTTVVRAAPADEPILRNLGQLYAYDFAEIMSWDIPDSGHFPDSMIDGCFDGSGLRHPFLLRLDGRLAGFAIVDMRSRLTGDEGVRDMAEFFVSRTVRGRGVGAEAAQALFTQFGGRWEVRQTESNRAALAFWRNVIGRYTGGRFEETIHNSPRWHGPVQSFVCDAAAPASARNP